MAAKKKAPKKKAVVQKPSAPVGVIVPLAFFRALSDFLRTLPPEVNDAQKDKLLAISDELHEAPI